MTKKVLIIITTCLTCMTGWAHDMHQIPDSIPPQVEVHEQPLFKSLTPTYLTNVSEAANWGKNWFIEAKGGASAFLGSPIGCGDVFDRLSPSLQVGVGKWFTPAVGGRVSYQGFQFKNAGFSKMKYQWIHADFMYNVTGSLSINDKGLSRWDVIPFMGVGMIHNSDWSSDCTCSYPTSGSHPFAFSFGVEVGYRMNDRSRVIAEVSGMTTARNFDGLGASSRFGDHMLSVSAGLSFNIGKVGFKRVLDARPYVYQNDWLITEANWLHRTNEMLTKLHQEDERLIAEYNKILEIEGLLDMYKDQLARGHSYTQKNQYPKNDYSGLNSLRARLANRGWDGNANMMPRAMEKRKGYEVEKRDLADDYYDKSSWHAYLSAMMEGKEFIGSPIYFFFHIGTSDLTESSQTLNIDEIAKVANKYQLHVKVIGAADSATGSDAINETLSRQRADYIKSMLVERGVNESYISTIHEGGIDAYSPVQANRQTQVTLSL